MVDCVGVLGSQRQGDHKWVCGPSATGSVLLNGRESVRDQAGLQVALFSFL